MFLGSDVKSSIDNSERKFTGHQNRAFPLPLWYIFHEKNYCPVTKPACNSYGSRLVSEPHSFRELGARHLVCPPWLSVPARGGPPLVDSVSLHLSELAEVSPDLVSSPRLNLPVTAWEVMLAIVR